MTTIYLVSCVATKASVPCAAKDLFRSVWFQKARRLAEAGGGPWFVLSAKHGLVNPDAVLAPYNVSLGRQPILERRAWAERAWRELEPRVQPQDEVVFLAGPRAARTWLM